MATRSVLAGSEKLGSGLTTSPAAPSVIAAEPAHTPAPSSYSAKRLPAPVGCGRVEGSGESPKDDTGRPSSIGSGYGATAAIRYCNRLVQARRQLPSIEVNPSTRVAAVSVGLLLGSLVLACGGSDTAGHVVSTSTSAPTTTGIDAATDDGRATVDSVSIAPVTAGSGSDAVDVVGAQDGTASDTVATETASVEDAGDGDAPSTEEVEVPATAGWTTVAYVSGAEDEPPAMGMPFGSASAIAVYGAAARDARRTPNDQLVLYPVTRIDGDFAPKSVVASGTGLYFAQNMMYRHTISVLDHRKELVATIDDSVNLRKFGYDVAGDVYRGSPVEAAFTSDGSFAFVSNYRMYGPGYDPEAGSDSCGRDQGQDSFVYRVSATTFEIDRLYPVGPVPKHLAVTPDDRLLLVSNWCGFDVTVIGLAAEETLATVDVGRHPRGIAITGDGRTAYVAVMGSTGIAVIDLSAFSLGSDAPEVAAEPVPTYIRDVGISPRHLVLSPDGMTLYATLNGEDAVVAVDLGSGEVIHRVETGDAPRTMDISTDGTALYVVNYRSHTMSKIRTSDFAILQEFDTSPRPIGITYDAFNDEVWVSTYSGPIHVYAEGG